MEPTIALIVLVVLGIPLALAIWLIVRALNAKNHIDELSRRIDTVESELLRLRQSRQREMAKPAEAVPALQPKPVAPAPVTPPKPIIVTPPPIPSKPEPVFSEELPPLSVASEPLRQPAPKINWEQFMGVKGFAWLGGFALFLGVAFFVKYSFDNNLVPPELRVAIGFLIGLGLLVGGVVMSRKNYPALSQTLCATGVVILYAVTFACRSIYHFDFFGPIPTFLLMALITATAFLLAVRLDALVVAILGMLGGFLTPILLSTSQDNPLGLFGYIGILDYWLDRRCAGSPLAFSRRAWRRWARPSCKSVGRTNFSSADNISTVTKSSSPSPCCWDSTRSVSRLTGWRTAAAKSTRWLSRLVRSAWSPRR